MRFPMIPNGGVVIQYRRTLFPSKFAVRGSSFAAQRRTSKRNEKACCDAKRACRTPSKLRVPAKDLPVCRSEFTFHRKRLRSPGTELRVEALSRGVGRQHFARTRKVLAVSCYLYAARGAASKCRALGWQHEEAACCVREEGQSVDGPQEPQKSDPACRRDLTSAIRAELTGVTAEI